jgi:hypothetical protein
MTELPTPTGPPAEVKKNRSTTYKWIGVAVAAFVVFAVVTDDSKEEAVPTAVAVQAPTTTVRVAPTTTINQQDLDELIQMTAMNSVFDKNRQEICRLVRNLVNDGLSLSVVAEIAVDAFNEGLDNPMFPKVEREFRNRIRDCA